MRIVCPSCHAAYEVPEALLAAGKPVRCAKCGTEWVAQPWQGAPDAVPPPAPPPPRTPPRSPAPPAAAHVPPPPFTEPPPPAARSAPPPPESPAGMHELRAEPRLPTYRPRSVDTLDDARPPPRDDEIEPAPRRSGALLAWLVSLALLALLVWAAFTFRGTVIGAWPPSARLYAALGLH